MTGDGLRFALRGGELAAEVALAGLSRGVLDVHQQLHAARRQEFASKWVFNRTLRALVGSRVGVRAAAHTATLVPRLLRHAICYAGDLRGA
jgi:flavin-dependent dehydrogenase